MAKTEVFITDCDHADAAAEQEVFAKAGFPMERLQCTTQQEAIDQCQGARAFINQYLPMDEVIFKGIPTLKLIVRYGVGVDNVNLDDATRYGVQVCNVPDYGTFEVADQAMALTMTLLRKVHIASQETKQGIWSIASAKPIYRLSELTVGVLGTGRIGSAYAQRAQAFGCRVVGCEIDPSRAGSVKGIDYVDFEELLKISDVLSIHCPLTDETHHLFNETTLQKMKPNAFLINVSRGPIIDEAALNKAMDEKWIAGAGLDVMEKEPPDKNNPLLKQPNVLVTPHIGWYSEEASRDLKRLAAEEVVRFMKGEPVRCPVNKV